MKIILKDSTTIDNLGMNGSNYVSEKELDTSIFTDDNLSQFEIVDDDGNSNIYTHYSFIQQMKWFDGTYYIAFREKTAQEIKDDERDAYIETLEEALIEVYESMLS